jgi:type I restriction enzyme, S subunit
LHKKEVSSTSEGIKLVKLSEVIVIIKGKKPSRLAPDNLRYSIPYINIKAFEKGIISQYTDGQNSRLCQPDDILIVWDGARCGLVGRGVAGAIGSTLAKLEIKGLLPSFVFYFLQSQYKRINMHPRGIGIPHIDPNLFWNIEIPIFSETEQKRIVVHIESLLTQLDVTLAGLWRVQAALKLYKASVLKAAVEGRLVPQDPGDEPAEEVPSKILAKKGGGYEPPKGVLAELPEGWVLLTIEDACEKIVDCLHSTPKFKDSGFYCVDTNWIKPGKFVFTQARYVDQETYIVRNRRMKPQEDDVVFSREGALLGIAVRIPDNFDFCLGQRMMIFRPSKKLDAKFLENTLNSKYFRNKYTKQITGTASPHLNIGDIRKLTIPIPPKEEQCRIVNEIERRLSVVQELEQTVEASLKRASRLRQAILKQAFEGRLV